MNCFAGSVGSRLLGLEIALVNWFNGVSRTQAAALGSVSLEFRLQAGSRIINQIQ